MTERPGIAFELLNVQTDGDDVIAFLITLVGLVKLPSRNF